MGKARKLVYFYLKTLEVAFLLCVHFVKIYWLRFLEFVYFSVWRVVRRSFLKNWHSANFCKIWRHPGACVVLFSFFFVFLSCLACRISVSGPGMEPGPQLLKAWSPNPLGHQGAPLGFVFTFTAFMNCSLLVSPFNSSNVSFPASVWGGAWSIWGRRQAGTQWAGGKKAPPHLGCLPLFAQRTALGGNLKGFSVVKKILTHFFWTHCLHCLPGPIHLAIQAWRHVPNRS